MKTKRTNRVEPSAASLRAIPEVDFRGGVRGKYVNRFQNVFVLDPDLLADFPDSQSINDALRVVLTLRKMAALRAHRPKRRATRR